MTTLIEQLNSLIFERLQLVHEFVSITIEMENYLEAIRCGISKSKSLNGYVLSCASTLDSWEMSPQLGVSVSGSSFSVIEFEEKTEKNEDKTEIRRRGHKKDEGTDRNGEAGEASEKKKIPNFRPFGVLEPQPAKQTRKDAVKSLELACELASLRSKILTIDSKLEAIKKDFKNEPDQLEKLMKALIV